MSKELSPEINAIVRSQEKFTPSCGLEFTREQSFAIQQITKNEFATKIARQNPQSLLMAMANVANIGLSLNPATKYAYLVPRDNAIHLDISYIGLIKIATDTGSIKWAKAEIVRENDDFEYNGISRLPEHKMNPFKDRGAVIGVYCVAKTIDGDFLVDTMSLQEINEVRNTSKAKDSSYSPWNTFFTEMCKKTIIKRASKTWPKTDRMERLDNAIHVLNEHEGLAEQDDLPTDDQYSIMDKYAHKYDKKDNEIARIANKNSYTDITATDASKIIAYIRAVEAISGTVEAVKHGITNNHYLAIHEALEELTEDEQSVLFRAPTKGGPLTVDERKYISSEEFRKLVNEELDRLADEELDRQALASQQ